MDKADALVAKKRFKDAAELYRVAAEQFDKAIGATRNREVRTALRLLVDQCQQRANELGSLKNVTAPLKEYKEVKEVKEFKEMKDYKEISGSILGSLANARGLMSTQIEQDDMEPLTWFQLQTLSLLNPPNVSLDEPGPLDLRPTGKSIEELELENATLKQLLSQCSENLQLYESFHKKVKMNFKNYLAMLKRELSQQEKQRKMESDAKIEHLMRENQRLETTTKKLTQRWNELVESAKKRRDDKNS